MEEGGHPKCAQVCTGGEGYYASCVRTHLRYLFSCFFLTVSFIRTVAIAVVILLEYFHFAFA